MTRAIRRRWEIVALIAVPDGVVTYIGLGLGKSTPRYTAAQRDRHRRITKPHHDRNPFVPVPMQPTMAVGRPVTYHLHMAGPTCQAGQIEPTRHKRRSPDTSVVLIAIFIGQVDPKR